MKPHSFSMHRLATDETARRSVIDAGRAAPNGELADVERSIAAHEMKHGFSSAEAVTRVERGELAPTLEIEGWLMAIRVRDDLADLKSGKPSAR